MEAQEWCRKYMKSGNVKDLTQAWDLYYHVFRRISKQLPQVWGEVQFLLWTLQCKLSIPVLDACFLAIKSIQTRYSVSISIWFAASLLLMQHFLQASEVLTVAWTVLGPPTTWTLHWEEWISSVWFNWNSCGCISLGFGSSLLWNYSTCHQNS